MLLVMSMTGIAVSGFRRAKMYTNKQKGGVTPALL